MLGSKAPAPRLAAALEGGLSPSGAFAQAGFSLADCAVVEAGASAGRLEQVFAELAAHYQRLATARAKILAQSLYPVFILHLGAILLAIPPAVLESSAVVFFTNVAIALGTFYSLGLLFFLAWLALSRIYGTSPAGASVIAWLPVAGRWLLTSTGARFASLFSLFVRSGGRPLRGLELAGEASGSALLNIAAKETSAAVRAGASLAESFSGRQGVPDEIERAVRVGDHSGRLDEESLRAAKTLDERASAQIEAFAEWLPRLVYLAISLYIGWRIIQTALHVGSTIGDALEL